MQNLTKINKICLITNHLKTLVSLYKYSFHENSNRRKIQILEACKLTLIHYTKTFFFNSIRCRLFVSQISLLLTILSNYKKKTKNYYIIANPSSGLPVFNLSPSNVPGSTDNVYLKGTTIVLICQLEVGKCRRFIGIQAIS